MRKFILPFLFLLLFSGFSSKVSAQYVNWMSWEEAIKMQEKEAKKIFVDVYIDLCNWCKKMDREAFADPHIVQYLNENFYPVKLNAQQENDIVFNNKIYRYVRQGRNSYHELAAMILNGKMSYPTIVFLDENAKVIQSIPGYRSPLELELFITYFGDNHHKRTPWSSFKKQNRTNSLKNNTPQINVSNNKY